MSSNHSRRNSNPVLSLEMRVRWRGGRVFLTLLAVAALPSVGMVRLYGASAEIQLNSVTYSGETTLDALQGAGRQVFSGLSYLLMIVMLVLAPVLTATSIAGEREKGLLEAMQLSRLTAPQIVSGKLFSALSLIVLILLTTLPISSISFLMGGMSPGDFVAAYALSAMTATTGAAIGLACSAWIRRAGAALPVTSVVVFLWLLISACMLDATHAFGTPSKFLTFLAFDIFSPLNNSALVRSVNLLGHANPLAGMWALQDVHSSLLSPNVSSFELQPVVACFLMQTLICIALLRLAILGTRKTFPEQPVAQRKKVLALRRTKNGWWLGLHPALETSSYSTVSPIDRDEDANQPGRRPRLHEAPLLSFIRFPNPVLHHEFHSKFRIHHARWLIPIEVTGFLFVSSLYVLSLFIILDGRGTETWAACTGGGLLVSLSACALMSGKAFTREREVGSLEALQLSLLPRAHIVPGKFLAPLLVCLVFWLPWIPILSIGIRHVRLDYVRQTHYASLTQALTAPLVVATTAGLTCAIGLAVSWRSRRSVTAIAVTAGILAVMWVFLPAALFSFINFIRVSYLGPYGMMIGGELPDPSGEGNLVLKVAWFMESAIRVMHPLRVTTDMFTNTRTNPGVLPSLICAGVQSILTTLILVQLNYAMIHGGREKDMAKPVRRLIPSRSARRPAAVKVAD